MRLTRAIPAGMIDAGLASLATFIVNLFAIATWEEADPVFLGIYFLFMTALIMATTAPTQLLFVPAEKITLRVPQRARVALYRRIFRLGLPVTMVAALLVSFPAAVGVAKGVAFSDQLPLLLTAWVAAVFQPLQTHARRLLHLAGHSWAAAAVSLVQMGAAASALVVMTQAAVADAWVPIGALAAANLASTAAASLLARQFSRALDPDAAQAATDTVQAIGYREIAPSGRWLVSTGLLSTGNNFLVESAVTFIVGLPAMALAGAAKTVAQPILVLATGLRSVLGPPSMEAAQARDRSAARGVARTFNLLTLAAVIGYVAIAGFDWPGNPLAVVVEEAYTVPFLVVLTIAANGLNGVAFPGRLELIGAGRERRLFFAELRANVAQLVVAVGAALAAGGSVRAGSFARPVAFAALGGARLYEYERQLNVHYRQPPDPQRGKATLPAASDVPPEIT